MCKRARHYFIFCHHFDTFNLFLHNPLKTVKTIRHGQLIIIRGEKQYNAQGQEL